MILRTINSIVKQQNQITVKKQILLFETSKRFLINSTNKMAEHSYIGNSLKEILNRLQDFAPLCLASSWDNVGLLVDPMCDSKISNILLTNDLTEDIVQEAINTKSGLIISYHPNIFQGLKSVSHRTWKERIIIQCIKNNIAVFSPHTSWDAVQGGVNDWLAKALPVSISTPILPDVSDSSIGAGRFCTLEKGVSVREVVRLVKQHINLQHVRLALARNKDQDSMINTVALCAGSGNSVLSGVQADLYLTGEMLHHEVLNATQNNIHVILCNHSDSERGFLHEFQQKLENEILNGEAKVIVSAIDCDPLKTV